MTPASGQAPRQDYIWARNATGRGTITLDGMLNEPAWALAESMIIRLPFDTGIPGSGWKVEAGADAIDSTYATVKLLVQGQPALHGRRGPGQVGRRLTRLQPLRRLPHGDQGPRERQRPEAARPSTSTPGGIPTLTDPQPPGQSPGVRRPLGHLASGHPAHPRADRRLGRGHGRARAIEQRQPSLDTATRSRCASTSAPWATTSPSRRATSSSGTSRSTTATGSGRSRASMSSNRDLVAGSVGQQHVVRRGAHPRAPDVGTVQLRCRRSAPRFGSRTARTEPTPVIDGRLNDPVWSRIRGFDIRYGDAALRETYPGVGPWRSGQYQPTVNGGLAAVLDPGDATVKTSSRATRSVHGLRRARQVVQYHANGDRWDGFIVSLNDRVQRSPDHVLLGRRLTFQVIRTARPWPTTTSPRSLQDGGAPGGHLPEAGHDGRHARQRPRRRLPGRDGDRPDQARLPGRPRRRHPLPRRRPPRRRLVRSAVRQLRHADLVVPRARRRTAARSWGYLDPTLLRDRRRRAAPCGRCSSADAHPNPFRVDVDPLLARASRARSTLEVYDVQGRLVARQSWACSRPASIPSRSMAPIAAAGVYLYRLSVTDPETGAERSGPFGRDRPAQVAGSAPQSRGAADGAAVPARIGSRRRSDGGDAILDRQSGRAGAHARSWTVLWLLLLLFPGGAAAGTTGKITGPAVDEKKKPVPGVTVMVVGTGSARSPTPGPLQHPQRAAGHLRAEGQPARLQAAH